MRSSSETLSDMRRIPRLFSRRRTPAKPHIELLTLDGVGGRVFTRSIEHTFEQVMIRMRRKVLL
jgi:hypothetical protein